MSPWKKTWFIFGWHFRSYKTALRPFWHTIFIFALLGSRWPRSTCQQAIYRMCLNENCSLGMWWCISYFNHARPDLHARQYYTAHRGLDKGSLNSTMISTAVIRDWDKLVVSHVPCRNSLWLTVYSRLAPTTITTTSQESNIIILTTVKLVQCIGEWCGLTVAHFASVTLN